MISLKYYEYYRTSKDIYSIRLQMVQYALENGIKPAARKYSTAVKTVKKWVTRFKENKKAGLKEKPRRPNTCPHQLKPYWRFKLIGECQRLNELGKRKSAAALRKDLQIPASLPTVLKVLKAEGLYRGRRRVVEKKRDLREVKSRLKAFEKLQVDVKYLDDIPEMYSEYKAYNLPRYQFTARCVRTGALFICYAREKTVTNAAIFMLRLQKHFEDHGLSLSGNMVQTDNGTEFTSPWNSMKKTSFTLVVERAARATHHLIPPGAKTWQSDVESSHRLIEEEFYAAVPFSSCEDFLKKARLYTKHFNLNRYNTYKKGTPIELARLSYPDVKPEVFTFQPIILDNILSEVKDELALWSA